MFETFEMVDVQALLDPVAAANELVEVHLAASVQLGSSLPLQPLILHGSWRMKKSPEFDSIEQSKSKTFENNRNVRCSSVARSSDIFANALKSCY